LSTIWASGSWELALGGGADGYNQLLVDGLLWGRRHRVSQGNIVATGHFAPPARQRSRHQGGGPSGAAGPRNPGRGADLPRRADEPYRKCRIGRFEPLSPAWMRRRGGHWRRLA